MLFTYDNIGTVNIGNLRETFFVHQCNNFTIIHVAEQGDFLIDEKYTFEIGEKNKTQAQIHNVKNSYLATDNIEINNIIPVWLFGFMY